MSDDFPILAAVAAAPVHSFRVLEHLQSIGLPASRSTLYRRVDALIAAGFLQAEEARGPRGHVRRDLHLSDAGRERVAREAREMLREAPLESPAFALAVGCARMLDLGALPAVLRPRMARAAQQLTQEERASRGSAPEEWEAIACARRVAHLQADITWLQSVLARRIVGKTAAANAENVPERGAA